MMYSLETHSRSQRRIYTHMIINFFEQDSVAQAYKNMWLVLEDKGSTQYLKPSILSVLYFYCVDYMRLL